MATMVNLCLQNEIDLPYYRFRTEEVTLNICTGRLVDERMERRFDAFDGYLGEKLQGGTLSENQRSVLAYLIKSEWANELVRYTIMATCSARRAARKCFPQHEAVGTRHSPIVRSTNRSSLSTHATSRIAAFGFVTVMGSGAA